MNFSAHFRRVEFEQYWREGRALLDPIPSEALPCFVNLCQDILEPVRLRFGAKRVNITSGHRSAAHNKAVGGAPDSQHVATDSRCACDFQVPGVVLAEIFDWIRLRSGLPFDQIILERGRQARHEYDDVIHLSWSRTEPRRVALEGQTNGRGAYLARIVKQPEAWEV